MCKRSAKAGCGDGAGRGAFVSLLTLDDLILVEDRVGLKLQG